MNFRFSSLFILFAAIAASSQGHSEPIAYQMPTIHIGSDASASLSTSLLLEWHDAKNQPSAFDNVRWVKGLRLQDLSSENSLLRPAPQSDDMLKITQSIPESAYKQVLAGKIDTHAVPGSELSEIDMHSLASVDYDIQNSALSGDIDYSAGANIMPNAEEGQFGGKTLEVSIKGNQVWLEQSIIHMHVGSRLHIAFNKNGNQAEWDSTFFQDMFLRKNDICEFVQQNEIKALREGRTKLYFVRNSQVETIDIIVKALANSDLLAASEGLTSELDLEASQVQGLEDQPDLSAALPSDQAAIADSFAIAAAMGADKTFLNLDSEAGPSEAAYDESDLEVADEKNDQVEEVGSFDNAQYLSLVGQEQEYEIVLSDERTDLIEGRYYPAVNLSVQSAAAPRSEISDLSGRVVMRTRAGSQAIFYVGDERSLFLNSKAKLYFSSDDQHLTLPVLRRSTFDSYQEILGVSHITSNSSYCANILNQEGYLRNVEASIDVPADGPYFFNDYGAVGDSFPGTGANGRVCFLNIEYDMFSLTFYVDGYEIMTKPVYIETGVHMEDIVSLVKPMSVSLSFAPARDWRSVPLGSHNPTINTRFTRDITVYPFGNRPFAELKDGPIVQLEEYANDMSQLVLYADGAAVEESILYLPNFSSEAASIGGKAKHYLEHLFPKGFIEDALIEFNLPFQDGVGHAVINMDTGQSEQFALRVFQGLSQVDNAQIIQPDGMPFHLMLNLHPGEYQGVLYDKATGRQAYAFSFFVYLDTLSYVPTGKWMP